METMRAKWAKGLLGSLGLFGLGGVLAHAGLFGLPVWGLAAMVVFINMGSRFWPAFAGVAMGVLFGGTPWGVKSSFLLIMAFVILAKFLMGTKIFKGYHSAFLAGVLCCGAVWGWRGFPVGAEQFGGAVLLGVLAAGFAVALQWLCHPNNWQGVLVKGTDIRPVAADIPAVGAWIKKKRKEKDDELEASQNGLRRLSNWKGLRFEVSVMAVSAVAVMGLAGVQLFGISAQLVFLGIVVMLLAEFRGSGAAAGAGILLGVLMGAAAPEVAGAGLTGVGSVNMGGLPIQVSRLMLSFGYAGVFGLLGWGCAVFGFLGRLGVVLAFFVLSLVGGYALNVGSLADFSLSALIAALAYLFLAPRGSVGMTLKEYMMPQIETTVNKVKTLANMFEEVAWGMQAAGEEAEVREPELTEMMNVLAEKVCYGCPSVNRCWDKEYYRTYQFFLDVLEGAESKLLIDENALEAREGLSEADRGAEVVGGPEGSEAAYRGSEAAYRGPEAVYRGSEARGKGSETIGKGSEERGVGEKGGKEPFCMRLERMELAADFIVAQEMERQVWKLNAKANRQELAGQYKSVSQVIHSVAHELFNHRAQSPVQSWKRRHMSKIDFGVASFMPVGEDVSGDAYLTLGIGEDKVVFIVCDGMGTGEEAAKLSNLALSILEQLLSTGFDPAGALKALNAIFVLRSPEESFVTLDMAVVDMGKNTLKLFKVGTPPSYIKRGSHVEVLRTSSLPVGVFNEVEVPLIERPFRSDILVLASDGVIDACRRFGEGENWVEKYLEDAGEESSQSLANAVVEEAVKLSGGKMSDDGIVLVVKKNKEV